MNRLRQILRIGAIVHISSGPLTMILLFVSGPWVIGEGRVNEVMRSLEGIDWRWWVLVPVLLIWGLPIVAISAWLTARRSGADAANNRSRLEKLLLNRQLPVAVDVEYYGSFHDEPPDAAEVRTELSALIDALRARGPEPVVYATRSAYDRYIAGGFPGTPIWIRSVVVPPPAMSDGREWTFWQYSNRDRLDGYDGEESFIDMNVFHGDLDELRALR